MTRPPNEDQWSFDFFDEDEDPDEATRETALPRRRPARPAWLGNSRVPAGRAGLARLGAACAAIVLVVVVIATVLGGGGAGAADRAYLNALAKPAQDSQAVGDAFTGLLAGPLSSYSDVESRLSALLRRQQQAVDQAAAIPPSPRLRADYQSAIVALQLRVSGLSGFQAALHSASGGSSKTDWATAMSAAVARLATSDVIWQDFFAAPSTAQLARDGATSAAVPGSRFLRNLDLTTVSAMTSVLDKLRPKPKTGATTAATAGVLQSGDTGAAVKAWQKQLNVWLSQQAGQSKIAVTGTFDQPTITATMAFQTANGLTADGVVGPATRAAVGTALP